MPQYECLGCILLPHSVTWCACSSSVIIGSIGCSKRETKTETETERERKKETESERKREPER